MKILILIITGMLLSQNSYASFFGILGGGRQYNNLNGVTYVRNYEDNVFIAGLGLNTNLSDSLTIKSQVLTEYRATRALVMFYELGPSFRLSDNVFLNSTIGFANRTDILEYHPYGVTASLGLQVYTNDYVSLLFNFRQSQYKGEVDTDQVATKRVISLGVQYDF